MKTILFNGKNIQIDKNQSLQDLLKKQGYEHGYFAVACNRKFISKIQYASTLLAENDLIEIITPMQGG